MHINTKLATALLLCSAFPVSLALIAGDAAEITAAPHSADSTVCQGKRLVWHDEFDGNSLDTTTWNIEVNSNGNGNGELQHYSSRGVSLGREPETGAHCLILTARRERKGNCRFTSGRVTTAGKRYFTHGILESRIKLPRTKNGVWPAFWLLGNNYREVGWPRCGEIDILEMGNADGIKNGTQTRLFNGACHWGFYNEHGQYPNHVAPTMAEHSLQDGKFHTFTLEWTPAVINMYLDRDTNPDAKPYYSIGIADRSDALSMGHYFHHDFFVIFNLAVGGYFTGITDPKDITALPHKHSKAQMYIDWVRLYQ